MCNACKTYKRILGLCGKFWYLLSAVLIVFFIDNPYPALADLGNSAAGDDQLALVLAGLDLNNRPVQILDEPHSLLRCHDVALIQAVLPVLVDQNHFHQNFVLAVLVVHLNIAVLQAILDIAALPQQDQQENSNQDQQDNQQADPAQGDKGAHCRHSATDDLHSHTPYSYSFSR